MSNSIHLLKPFLDKYFNDIFVFHQSAYTHQDILQADDIDLAFAAHAITQDTYSNLINQCSTINELLQLLAIKEEHHKFLQNFALRDALYWWFEGYYYPTIFVEEGAFPEVFGSTEPCISVYNQLNKVPFIHTYRNARFSDLSGYWMGDMKLGDMKKILSMSNPIGSEIHFFHVTSWTGVQHFLEFGPRGRSNQQDFGCFPKFYLYTSLDAALDWCDKKSSLWKYECAIIRYTISSAAWEIEIARVNHYYNLQDDQYQLWQNFIRQCRTGVDRGYESRVIESYSIIQGPVCANPHNLPYELPYQHTHTGCQIAVAQHTKKEDKTIFSVVSPDIFLFRQLI